jgi:hypothetical protein
VQPRGGDNSPWERCHHTLTDSPSIASHSTPSASSCYLLSAILLSWATEYIIYSNAATGDGATDDSVLSETLRSLHSSNDNYSGPIARSLQQWGYHSELIHEVQAVDNVTSSLSCEDIFKSYHRPDDDADGANKARYLCHYAQNCDGDRPSTTLLPLILCRGVDTDIGADDDSSFKSTVLQSAVFVHYLLPPIILCYLYLLFRLLATTADCYFSPALETFSFEMGLPPRFAGAVRVYCV